MTYSPADIKLAHDAFEREHVRKPVENDTHDMAWLDAYLLAHTRQQAVIDELMWEWCPKEMTQEQKLNYEFYQVSR